VSDLNLLTFGAVVTFIACAGGYVMLREGFVRGVDDAESAAPPAEARPRQVAEAGPRSAAG
jgi:hypothetical protein